MTCSYSEIVLHGKSRKLNLKEKLSKDLEHCSAFSLQMDESIDVVDFNHIHQNNFYSKREIINIYYFSWKNPRRGHLF